MLEDVLVGSWSGRLLEDVFVVGRELYGRACCTTKLEEDVLMDVLDGCLKFESKVENGDWRLDEETKKVGMRKLEGCI